MLGERPDGKWASFEFGVVAPRQNGKDAIFEGRELTGLFLLNEQLIIHSAHEQATATEHFRRLLNLIEGVPEFDRRVLKAPKGKGAEAIELRGGQRIFFKTRTAGGGRGFTGDLVVLNEAMIVPGAFTAALVPTMAARSIEGNPQLVYGASAVDQQQHEHGIVLSRLRHRAMKGAMRVGYCEWSVDVRAWLEAHGLEFDPKKPEIEQVPAELLADPEAWAESNPGLGIRISQEHIANEQGGSEGGAMAPREFMVERLGIGDWPSIDGTEGSVLNLDTWNEIADEHSKATGPVAFSFDVSPDRSSSTIAAAGSRADGHRHIEVIDYGRGTAWVIDRLVELKGRHAHVGIVCDGAGPAGSLVPELEQRGIDVTIVNAKEHAQACGLIYDAIESRTVHHGGKQTELNAAVRVATRRTLGDAWAWSRRGSTIDISPLVACTLAFWGSVTLGPSEPWASSW